ncbi:MAG TPA: TIGR03619 family F420-dependent LLM class oxidoreductase [Dehalococcoidia bacterium]|nr:TIGR03619 family F420-dependent LLM class oxidoreductase [Dehalococcoidia bacterium]
MKFGTSFPIIAMDDPGAARDLAQTLDGAGFDYATAAGHLLSTPADRYEGRPPATFAGPFIDPFVLFGYLAGLTNHLHFVTGILILPLYDTAVVAKQSAELDFVSGGRFEMGVGLSWQEPEYKAVGKDIHNRGARLAEQVEVLRLFWTQPFFTFKGKYHDIDNMGLNRVPSKPIPVWFGSTPEERPMRRAARLGDGWMPMGDPTDAFPQLKQYMADAGRSDAMPLMSRVTAGEGGPDAWVAEAKRLQGVGATHITLGAPPDLTGDAATKRLLEAKGALAAALG